MLPVFLGVPAGGERDGCGPGGDDGDGSDLLKVDDGDAGDSHVLLVGAGKAVEEGSYPLDALSGGDAEQSLQPEPPGGEGGVYVALVAGKVRLDVDPVEVLRALQMPDRAQRCT